MVSETIMAIFSFTYRDVSLPWEGGGGDQRRKDEIAFVGGDVHKVSQKSMLFTN